MQRRRKMPEDRNAPPRKKRRRRNPRVRVSREDRAAMMLYFARIVVLALEKNMGKILEKRAASASPRIPADPERN